MIMSEREIWINESSDLIFVFGMRQLILQAHVFVSSVERTVVDGFHRYLSSILLFYLFYPHK